MSSKLTEAVGRADITRRAETARFKDRADAGRRLAALLARYRDSAPVILGIPSGGVPVAGEVARALGADLDVLLVQPIRSPRAAAPVGALAERGVPLLDQNAELGDGVDDAVQQAARELRRRAAIYRGGRPAPDIAGRTAIIVDDGVVTGRTLLAALATRPYFQPRRLIIAAPVAPVMVARRLGREADDAVFVKQRGELLSIADAYEDYHPLVDTEVLGELAHGRAFAHSAPATMVVLDVDEAEMTGSLSAPRGAGGVVLVPYAGSAGRMGAACVARAMSQVGIATFAVDTGVEPGRQCARLVAAIDWTARAPETSGMPIVLFESLPWATKAASLRPDAVVGVVADTLAAAAMLRAAR